MLCLYIDTRASVEDRKNCQVTCAKTTLPTPFSFSFVWICKIRGIDVIQFLLKNQSQENLKVQMQQWSISI